MNEGHANIAELPRAAYLSHTLRRARSAAEQRSHRYVMLEHLLLALLDDPDAQRVLQLGRADTAVLRSAIWEAVNHRMATLVSPGNATPSFSYKFELVIQSASNDAAQLGRREVDGGFVIIALAKEPESFAGEALRKNGFDSGLALEMLAQGGGDRSPPERAPSPARAAPSPAPPPSPPPLPPVPAAASSDSEPTMDEMLASVRALLEQEEQKFGASSPAPIQPPKGPPLADIPSLSRREPDERKAGAPSQTPLQAPRPLSPSLAPGMGQAPGPAPGQPPRPPAPGGDPSPYAARPGPKTGPREDQVAERQQSAPSDMYSSEERHALQPAARPAAGARPPAPAAEARRRRELDEVASGKLVENIPRAMRVAVPEIVEIRLSREESVALFEGLQGRGETQTHNINVTRAMTVRLRAPSGGFFIETLSPETQWVLDRPSFLGGEPFGRWVWTVIPNEQGQHQLQVIIASRSIDETGLAGDIALPDQVIDIAVRTNYRRSAAQFFRAAFLLLAGGALTEGALYLARMAMKF